MKSQIEIAELLIPQGLNSVASVVEWSSILSRAVRHATIRSNPTVAYLTARGSRSEFWTTDAALLSPYWGKI